MARTGIIYQARTDAETAAVRNLMLVLGAGRYFKPGDFTEDKRQAYDFYCLGGPMSGGRVDTDISAFVADNAAWLKTQRVVLFGLGAAGAATDAAFAPLKEILGDAVLAAEVIDPAPDSLAALAGTGLRLKKLRDAADLKLPPSEMKEHVEAFLGGHKYCILATGAGNNVRATAVTYKYHEGHVYIVCEGAAKFANLIQNPNVSIALHAPYQKGSMHAGIQLSGQATLLDPASDAYREMMRIKGSDYDRLTSLPFILWGLDVKLTRAEFWWSEWRNQGVSPKQSYDFE